MSQVKHNENDFKGLEFLDPEIAERVKQARIEARDIIDRLEPFHIDSWVDLLTKLDRILEDAVHNAELLDPTFGERQRRDREMKKFEKQTKEKKQAKYLEEKLYGNAARMTILGLILYIAIALIFRTEGFAWGVIVPIVIVSLSWVLAIPLALRSLHKIQKLELKAET